MARPLRVPNSTTPRCDLAFRRPAVVGLTNTKIECDHTHRYTVVVEVFTWPTLSEQLSGEMCLAHAELATQWARELTVASIGGDDVISMELIEDE